MEFENSGFFVEIVGCFVGTEDVRGFETDVGVTSEVGIFVSEIDYNVRDLGDVRGEHYFLIG